MGSLQTTIRDLRRRKARERRGLALAEGVRLVEEALAAGVPVRGAVVSPALEATSRGQTLKSTLAERGIRLVEVDARELDELSDTDQPQGIVAVLEPKEWSLAEVAIAQASVVLVLDAVQDPGNVGTMLRTALALGAAGLVALKGTAELTNPKVLRGSMGALFRLPSVTTTPEEFLSWRATQGLELWIAAADGEPIRRSAGSPRRPGIALVVGNEGAGVSQPLEAAASRRVAVPLARGVESLNVAVAAGILLYEVTRAD